MEVVYAFCRVVDDVVDRNDVASQEAHRELNRWRQELQAAAQGVAAHPIAVALGSVIHPLTPTARSSGSRTIGLVPAEFPPPFGPVKIHKDQVEPLQETGNPSDAAVEDDSQHIAPSSDACSRHQ